ncbi:MAG TPA: aminomethyltransferase family protein [Burkholderiales bacterium]|jgi:glycine cleavage system aminomethyltransferase T|nr:aminomethyltransferase family protein [Burkholderiales bacterium]
MSAADEHLATRRAAGLFDFSFMGLYEFIGTSDLQQLQTRRLADLEKRQIAYTLLLKPDGAVLIDATVWNLGEERFWLFAGRRAAYGGRDRSGELAILALQGPASGRILARLIGSDAVCSLRYFHFCENEGLTVGRIGYSGELGYELLVPAADAARLKQDILEEGKNEGLCECGWAAADSLRIEAGYVLFDREIDGRANPRELGLERLAPGRKDFEVRRRLVGLDIAAAPAPAALPAARVTSECFSPLMEKRIALGFAPPQSLRAGSVLRLEDGRLARAVPLPFYDAERRRPRADPL